MLVEKNITGDTTHPAADRGAHCHKRRSHTSCRVQSQDIVSACTQGVSKAMQGSGHTHHAAATPHHSRTKHHSTACQHTPIGRTKCMQVLCGRKAPTRLAARFQTGNRSTCPLSPGYLPSTGLLLLPTGILWGDLHHHHHYHHTAPLTRGKP